MDEKELEQVLRAGLESRSTEADVTAPVADRARADVSRRRRSRYGVLGAAAAVVFVVGGIAVVTGRGGDDATPRLPVADDSPPTEVQPTRSGEWRTEYWRGVAVDVPADWGYGTVPYSHDQCAQVPGAVFGADGSRLRNQERAAGYVGRPISIEDVCAIDYIDPPEGPVVWFDADDAFTGLGDETVEVAGVTVTVASSDRALREAILATVRATDGGCQPSHDHIPRALFMNTREGRGDLLSAEVCAYRSNSGTVDFRLSYAAAIDLDDFEDAVAAAEAAPRSQIDCDYNPFEFVALRAIYADPVGSGKLVRTAVYQMGCGGTFEFAGVDGVRVLTPEAVEPWVHNGIPAVVYGPTGGKGAMIDSFTGPLG